MAGDVQVRMIVTGRVQGVFFRASALEQAQSLGVKGSVRNLPDGEVEIIARGDPDAVEALARWAHRGPPEAEVKTVHISEMEPDESLVTFQVVR